MSKEELERASVQGLSSSVPPRRTSDAPAILPSIPPSTDDIDTDWGEPASDLQSANGFDDSNEVTHVMDQPLRVSFTPRPGSEPPPPPPEPVLARVASASPPPPPAPEPEPALGSDPASSEPEPRVPSMRPIASTLIGLPIPTPPNELTEDFAPAAAESEARDSTPPPMPSAAYSEPVRASVPPPPPPPSVPPPPLAAPSVPPPAVAAPAAHSSAPPPRSSVPAPSLSSPVPDVATQAAAAAHSSGFGRWLAVLAAGLVVVSVLGYRVLTQNRAALVENASANALVEPAAPVKAAAEPAPVAASEPAAPSAAASAAATTDVSLSAATPAADAAPSPAASASAPPASAAEGQIRRVTVKSRPAKVRFFHFGKQVGVTPFVLEFKPGERHAYEAALPGYGVRKVVIDGSKPEIVIGLKKETP